MYPIPDWPRDAVFYEIFPERFANGDPSNDPPEALQWDGVPTRTNFFGGDLRGIIEKLDYLESLGVNALYLTPIFAAKTNHKYDTIDYFQIDPHFGDRDTFRQLLYEAHARDMRIVLDAVFNHAGVDFWAFRDVIERGEASAYVNWFYIEDLPVTIEPTPNYSTYENASYLVKLNVHNPEVRRYLYEVARTWTREGIDGWRLDVPYFMNHRFWKGFRRAVKALNPDLYIVGEIWERATDWLQGDECDGAMNYRLRSLVLDFFVEGKLDATGFGHELAVLRAEQPGDTAWSMLNLLGSHDTPRLLTLCHGDRNCLCLATAFLFTYVGIPMIYYGDEVGMTGENDPDCRRAMVWEPTAQAQGILQWHQRLIHLRQTHSALRRGSFRQVYASAELYVFERQHEWDSVLVILNRGATAEALTLPAEFWPSRAVLSSAELSADVNVQFKTISVPARSVLLLVPERSAEKSSVKNERSSEIGDAR